ncbi:hypothetical protein GCM10011383_14560 [Hymenobacter cavernae]|uniref:Glycosyltransferase RgtA/B/C/D-like domain-containing protein n=1 Tax=Hymenobacter cavernae TaxID=2044852 RepID=A0ABQ1TW92_9BACT|nr:hypothetical protein GCM10011383_14560 [Hymenobacter cavernae]
MQAWDEARTGLNGLEIWRYHDWLVLRHNGQPDLWNSKPPLWPWILAVSFRLLGATELGLRLPSALAALATMWLLYRAGQRWLGSSLAGLLAGLILLTTQGYVQLHVARSGDFDTLLTLWTTAGALAWLAYLGTGRNRWAWATGIFFSLAVFTKGIAGVLFGPGLLLAALLTGHVSRLRRSAPWLAVGLVILTAGSWYALREMIAPGYLAAVWQYEVGGPAAAELEGHHHTLGWYLSAIVQREFTAWLIPALLGWLLSAWAPRTSRSWLLGRFTASVAGCFLLAISLVKTKLGWYDAPIFPLLALQAAAGLVWTGRILAAHLKQRPQFNQRLVGVLSIAVLPYYAQRQFIRDLDKHRLDNPQLLYGRHLRAQHQQLPTLTNYVLVTDGAFNDSPVFYRTAAEFNYNHQTTSIASWDLGWLRPGQTVVACGAKAYRPLLQRYQTRVLLRTDSCQTLELLGLR